MALVRNYCLVLLTLPVVFLVWGCIIDGPNQTGTTFLEDQGLTLHKQLDSVKVRLPVDSFWVQGVDSSVTGGNGWLVGGQGNFSAVARLGFMIDTGMVISSHDFGNNASKNDSLRSDSLCIILHFLENSLTIKEQIAEYTMNEDTVLLVLDALIYDLQEDLRDQQSFDFFIKADSLSHFEVLYPDPGRVSDTIAFNVAKAVSGTNRQIFRIPNIFNKLLERNDKQQLLFLQISTLETEDNNMLHFGSVDSMVFGKLDTMDRASVERIDTSIAGGDTLYDTTWICEDTAIYLPDTNVLLFAIVRGDTSYDTTWRDSAGADSVIGKIERKVTGGDTLALDTLDYSGDYEVDTLSLIDSLADDTLKRDEIFIAHELLISGTRFLRCDEADSIVLRILGGDTLLNTVYTRVPLQDNMLSLYSFISKINNWNYTMRTYRISHPSFNDQKNPMLLTGKTQGLHFSIERSRLLSELMENSSIVINDGDAEYNSQYFIPYAGLSIPLSTDIKRKYDVNIRFDYEIDSSLVVGGLSSGTEESVITVPLGRTGDANLLVVKTGTEKVMDTLSFVYFRRHDDLPLYELALLYSNDSTRNDTVQVDLEKPFEYLHSSYSRTMGTNQVLLTISADTSKALVAYHFSTSRIPGPSSRYLNSESNHIEVNGTYGVQTLFNRIGPEGNLSHDFFVMPGHLAGRDTTNSTNGFLLFSEIPVSLDSRGKLLLDVNIYYYEL
jgi:hypothetical protein